MTYHTLFPRYVRTPFWLAVVIMAVVLVANVATCASVRSIVRLTTPPPAEQMGSILWGDYHLSCIDRPGYFDTTRPGVQSSDEGND